LDAKFLDVGIEHELFAGDQRNAQQASVALKHFPRNAFDKGMVLKQGGPNGRKIISLAYQLRAMAREIARSLLGHFDRPIRDVAPPLDGVDACDASSFAFDYYMRDKTCGRIFFMKSGVSRSMSFQI
jgi:hypothetical protein